MPCRPMALSMPDGRFGDAWWRMALTFLEEQSLDRHAAEQ